MARSFPSTPRPLYLSALGLAKLPEPSAADDLPELNVPPAHVAYLWSCYQENVEPLIKMLHVPSVEPVMKDARRDRKKLSIPQTALFLSICHSAIISLGIAEVGHMFATSPDFFF